MTTVILNELKKLRRSSYWVPALIVALITAIVITVGVALARHDDGPSDAEVCKKKTEALMEQIIKDAKLGRDPADTAPIPECTKISTEARVQILHDVLAKYGEQWTQALTGTLTK
jgi:hypothetical protein